MKMIRLSVSLCFILATTAVVGQHVSEKNTGGRVKNIILMIGDGMGVAQVNAGIIANKGYLNMMELPVTGFSKTSPASDFITDSGAAATAISTGYKTYDHAIGMDADTIARPTILEYAEWNGKATGMVVTSQVTHATPAAFIAHQKERYMYEEIAADFLNTDIDVFIGGGRNHFIKRKDNRDLTTILKANDYQVVYRMIELMKIDNGKVAGLLYDDAPPRTTTGRKDMLPEATQKAIDILDQSDGGFFLMVEGSQIDWGGHDKDTEYVVEELLDFDAAVGIALAYAKNNENTLLIVTSDHETGGMALVDGDETEGKVKARFTSSNHTGVMVPVFAYGPGAEDFSGIYENTEIFDKMIDAFGFDIR